ncbi:hypothetical protein C8F01DRAFT_1083705 [Mycena amicta]|nr:hypothetical protein C8F01DRAFT_1083705 [Mycena amicta]
MSAVRALRQRVRRQDRDEQLQTHRDAVPLDAARGDGEIVVSWVVFGDVWSCELREHKLFSGPFRTLRLRCPSHPSPCIGVHLSESNRRLSVADLAIYSARAFFYYLLAITDAIHSNAPLLLSALRVTVSGSTVDTRGIHPARRFNGLSVRVGIELDGGGGEGEGESRHRSTNLKDSDRELQLEGAASGERLGLGLGDAGERTRRRSGRGVQLIEMELEEAPEEASPSSFVGGSSWGKSN